MSGAEWKPLPFDEAIALFKSKVVLTPEEYKALEAAVSQAAFTVSGITEADIINDIYDELQSALEKGTTFIDFKKQLLPKIESAWGSTAPYRLDTIFRTNIQSMYQAGHWKQQMEVVDTRPYWQYVAVMDGRVRPAHAAMNGKVLPADDPFWQQNYPPNGFNCRCTVRSLSTGEMDREGLSVSNVKQNIFDKGFGTNPADLWTPDLSKYPDWLREKMTK
jgi:SPP1 gp7 family putative phage head morphogenesis protein